MNEQLWWDLVNQYTADNTPNGIVLSEAYQAFRRDGDDHIGANVNAIDVMRQVEDNRWWRDHPEVAQSLKDAGA